MKNIFLIPIALYIHFGYGQNTSSSFQNPFVGSKTSKLLVLEKEEPNMEEYGGTLGLGVCLGGGGLAGIPVRAYLNRKIVAEAGVFFRPSFTDDEFKLPVMLAGGMDYFFSDKYVSWKGKIIKNGMMIRGGKTLIPDYSESMLAIGWAHEGFKIKNKKYSFLSYLGAGALFYGGDYYPLEGAGLDWQIIPLLYWKIQFNWFLI